MIGVNKLVPSVGTSKKKLEAAQAALVQEKTEHNKEKKRLEHHALEVDNIREVLQDEVSQLKRFLESEVERNGDLEKELETEKKSREDDLVKSKEEINGLKTDLENLNKKNEEEREKWDEERDSFVQKVQESAREIEKIKIENESQYKKFSLEIEKLNGEIAQIKNEAEEERKKSQSELEIIKIELENEKSNSRLVIEKYESEKKNFLAEFERLKGVQSELEEEKKKRVSLEQTVATLNSQVSESKHKSDQALSELIRERDGLKSSLAIELERGRGWARELESSRFRVASLEESLKISNQQVADLRAKREEEMKEIMRVQEDISLSLETAQAQKFAAERQLEDSKVKLRDMTESVEGYRKKISKLGEELASRNEALEELEREIDQMRAKMSASVTRSLDGASPNVTTSTPTTTTSVASSPALSSPVQTNNLNNLAKSTEESEMMVSVTMLNDELARRIKAELLLEQAKEDLQVEKSASEKLKASARDRMIKTMDAIRSQGDEIEALRSLLSQSGIPSDAIPRTNTMISTTPPSSVSRSIERPVMNGNLQNNNNPIATPTNQPSTPTLFVDLAPHTNITPPPHIEVYPASKQINSVNQPTPTQSIPQNVNLIPSSTNPSPNATPNPSPKQPPFFTPGQNPVPSQNLQASSYSHTNHPFFTQNPIPPAVHHNVPPHPIPQAQQQQQQQQQHSHNTSSNTANTHPNVALSYHNNPITNTNLPSSSRSKERERDASKSKEKPPSDEGLVGKGLSFLKSLDWKQ